MQDDATLGVLQMLPSPWNDQRRVLVVTGTAQEAIDYAIAGLPIQRFELPEPPTHELELLHAKHRAVDLVGRDSDLDLLIIEPAPTSPRASFPPRSTPYYMALGGLYMNIDVLVYTPPEIEQWSAVPMAFITTALREGKVLYDAQGTRRPRQGLVRQG